MPDQSNLEGISHATCIAYFPTAPYLTKESEVHNMFKHDGEEAVIGLIVGLVVICVVVYVIVLLATIIAGIAAAGGTLYGGRYAIVN